MQVNHKSWSTFQISLNLRDHKGKFRFLTIFIIIRRYLLNVVNTVKPNSVVKAVLEAREAKVEKVAETKPIFMTEEMEKLFQDFVSL